MNIIVTGGSGFIGLYLVKRLKSMGENIISWDIKNNINITDWQQIREVEHFDAVFHLASKSFVPESYHSPLDFYHTNIVGTLNILELCRIRGARMIFTSSYVYGKPNFLPIDENHPIVALNPYAQSKIICEKICEGYSRDFNVPVVVIRPFNVYGLGQDKRFLIPTIIRQARSGRILLKDPTPRRDLIHVEDLVEAYIKVLNYHPGDFEVFNIGSGRSYPVKDIANMVIECFSTNIELDFTGEKRKEEIKDSVADISKAKALLGWQPGIEMKKGLKKVVVGSIS